MMYLVFLALGFALTSVFVSAAPVEVADTSVKIPEESVLGFLEVSKEDDIAVLPITNGTHSGFLFLNATLLNDAGVSTSDDIEKRSADAWHWLRLSGPMYKRDANADAEPWHWLRLSGPMYKRDADADAEPWHWLRLSGPMYKRDANADADAEPWHWLRLSGPMY